MTNEQKQTAGVAVASLILGILGLILLGPLGSIPAVICGHIGLSQIKKNPDTLQGGGLAIAGLVMGYLQIALLVILIPLFMAIAIPAVVAATDKAQEVVCLSTMQQIETAKDMWAMEQGLGDFSEIDIQAVNAQMGPGMDLTCPDGGVYEYRAIGVSPSCTVHGPLYQILETIDE
jgi:Domain of unknown function (DUF4190)